MEKQIVANGPFAAIIPDGVRVGDVIHLSGAVSVDETGALVADGDFLAQNRVAYASIAKALSELGAGLGDVVKETVFVTDMMGPIGSADAPFELYAAMRDEAYGGKGAEVAQSLVQVAGLVMPELLVEIEVIAHV